MSVGMARMAMMGRHSVDYHRKTLGIGATTHTGLDPEVEAAPSAALRYYSSHGETPLAWGGAGAEALGLVGSVGTAQYEAIFAEGGAFDPTTGLRLVRTRRPGMEIVVSAQKSVAELGVIGRAEHMHAILEAETEATIAYLDGVTRHGGGRRGRRMAVSPTQGLIYVRTRHATSRAGDPSPHDHILIANVVEMADEHGGFKAADTTVWRDHLHAATMVGRMAAAAKAVELGYAIEADPGPSGRLGHWRIAGVPRKLEAAHSKRGAEIDGALAESGFVSWRAKEVASNETRPRKRHTPLADLMSRWLMELEDAGYPAPELSRMVDEAARTARLEPLTLEALRGQIEDSLGPDGPLGRRKIFTRPDVIVALAPALYGRPPELLEAAVGRIIADPEVIPLIGVPGARQRAYTTAATVATEAAIADGLGAQMARTDAPIVPLERAQGALAEAEERLGRALTEGQRSLVLAASGSGRGAELVVGVAGSGKTKALEVLRSAFEAEGCTVIGAATSGQAARTLGREAGIEVSRTLASVTWRLEHGQLALTDRTVIILDEVGATDDPALLRLLGHAERAGAKVVLVGDWRQLGPVGPGGAFEALLRRHKGAVAVLSENVRQIDRAEADTLLALRSGSVPEAVAWYADRGRIVNGATRTETIDAAVTAWATDVSAGVDAMLLAWRKLNVAALNARAREAMEATGRLSGPELEVGSRRYRAGDRVVALAPAAGGEIVTSTRAVVSAVDPESVNMTVTTEDGRRLVLSGPELGADRLDHGYATTVHRAQGATCERSHLLADGGGRELAYVGMSRARESSVAYVVADDLNQARDDLAREWSAIRRPRWAIDTAIPGPDETITAVPGPDQAHRLALRRAYIETQMEAIRAAAPQDLSAQLTETTKAIGALRAERDDLLAGRGPHAEHVGPALAELTHAQARVARMEESLAGRPGLLERRRLGRELPEAAAALDASRQRYEAAVEPHRRRLDNEIDVLTPKLSQVKARSLSDQLWLSAHPEASRRMDRLVAELTDIRRGIENHRRALEGLEPLGVRGGRLTAERDHSLTAAQRMRRHLDRHPEPPTPSHGLEISL